MGAALVKAAYSVADRLGFQDHKAMRLYVFMAATALDNDPRPTYFGGPDALASALAVKDDSTVRATIRRLKAVGLVKATRAHTGRQATYALMNGKGAPLGKKEAGQITPAAPVDNSEETGQTAPAVDPRAGVIRAERRGDPPRRGGAPSPRPRRNEEKKEERRASAPARTCTRHPDWNHTEPCRQCGDDRRASETFAVSRRPATMSEQRGDCPPGQHRLLADGTCMLCTYRPGDEAAA